MKTARGRERRVKAGILIQKEEKKGHELDLLLKAILFLLLFLLFDFLWLFLIKDEVGEFANLLRRKGSNPNFSYGRVLKYY